MRNARRKFDRGMKSLLLYVVTENALPDLDDEKMQYLQECVAKEYVSGVYVGQMINGRLICESSNVRITPQGLNFLYPKKDTKFLISTGIAVFSILLNIIQALLPVLAGLSQ